MELERDGVAITNGVEIGRSKMRNIVIATLLLVVVYVLVMVGTSKDRTFENWIYASLVYLIGLSWVVPFLCKSTMYAYITGESIKAEKRHFWLRFFYFCGGVGLCAVSIIF